MTSTWSRLSDTLRGLWPMIERARSISFSQYCEDTLVYGLIPRNSGFYVDVGACHPWRASNTYKLYLRGWSGLTIEPNPDIAPLFRRVRPRDIHLTMGVAPKAGTLEFFRFDDPKHNSFHREQQSWMGHTPRSSIQMECQPIQEIIDRHASGRAIDLLAIDCEGFDFSVLETLNWSKNRPCAVIIEDYEQFVLNSEPGRQSAICSFLTARDYAIVSQGAFSFIYMDTTAFGKTRDAGFWLEQSQYAVLKRDALARGVT
jgi:FkbM family methyltransferase